MKTTKTTTVTEVTEKPDAAYDFKNKLNVMSALTFIEAQIQYSKAVLAEKPNMRGIFPLQQFIAYFKTIKLRGPRGFGFTNLAKVLVETYNGHLFVDTEFHKRDFRKTGLQNVNSISDVLTYQGLKVESDIIIIDDACRIAPQYIERLMLQYGADKFYILLN